MNQSPVKDDQWHLYEIIVKDQTITIKINGQTTAEWQPADWKPAAGWRPQARQRHVRPPGARSGERRPFQEHRGEAAGLSLGGRSSALSIERKPNCVRPTRGGCLRCSPRCPRKLPDGRSIAITPRPAASSGSPADGGRARSFTSSQTDACVADCRKTPVRRTGPAAPSASAQAFARGSTAPDFALHNGIVGRGKWSVGWVVHDPLHGRSCSCERSPVVACATNVTVG